MEIYPQTIAKIWCILLEEQSQCPWISINSQTELKSSSLLQGNFHKKKTIPWLWEKSQFVMFYMMIMMIIMILKMMTLMTHDNDGMDDNDNQNPSNLKEEHTGGAHDSVQEEVGLHHPKLGGRGVRGGEM